MKMYLKSRVLSVLIAACFVMLIPTAISTIHCNAESPKTVKRKGPLRLKPHVTLGEAKIPDGVTFGIMCDLDGVIQLGDWKSTGKITALESGLVIFTTDEFRVGEKIRYKPQTARLAYRLPHGLSLPLSVDDPITVMHYHRSSEKRLEWDIHISSGRKLILATTHQHDDTPPRSAENAEVLFDGAPGGHFVFFWSDPATNDLKQDLKVTGKVASPVSLRVRDNDQLNDIEAALDHPTHILLDGTDFFFTVLLSEHFDIDSHGHESDEHAESKLADTLSHSLECFLLRADTH